MNDERVSRENRQTSGSASKGKEKRLYQKPAFRHERVFETLALSCGKVGVTQATCKFSTKTS
jgi:hypothetical protein